MALKRGGSAGVVTEEVAADLTPMIDVTFQLLIFFMLTIRFKTLDGKFQTLLPLSRGLSRQAAVTPDAFRVSLRVAAEDRAQAPAARRVEVRIAGRREALGVFGPDAAASAATTAALRDAAAAVRRVSPETEFELDVGPDVPHAAAVALLDVAAELKYPAVSYAGLPAQEIARLIAPAKPR